MSTVQFFRVRLDDGYILRLSTVNPPRPPNAVYAKTDTGARAQISLHYSKYPSNSDREKKLPVLRDRIGRFLRGYTKSGTLPKCGSVTHDVKVDTSTKMCHTSQKV